MRQRFLIRRALDRLFPKRIEIQYRAGCILPAYVMLRQLCSNSLSMRAIASLQALPDALMPAHPPPKWHALI